MANTITAGERTLSLSNGATSVLVSTLALAASIAGCVVCNDA